MEYYQQLITEKSFQILQEFKKNSRFILIGGWAVFFYTHGLKSKDIDIIIDFAELENLKKQYEIFKNDRLKKYEIKLQTTDIDIYLPFYSELGLPTEMIEKHTLSLEGFVVPKIEILLILKQVAHAGRLGTPKGEKDKIDIFSLLNLKIINWNFYQQLLKEDNLSKLKQELLDLLKQTTEVKEINLNQNQMAKLKKEILTQITFPFSHPHCDTFCLRQPDG